MKREPYVEIPCFFNISPKIFTDIVCSITVTNHDQSFRRKRYVCSFNGVKTLIKAPEGSDMYFLNNS